MWGFSLRGFTITLAETELFLHREIRQTPSRKIRFEEALYLPSKPKKEYKLNPKAR